MKLLIFTQKVDEKDPVLGFFHNWLIDFSKHAEEITVICLYKGGYNLPKNIKVLSLGKEEGKSRIKYIKNFFKYVLEEKNNYNHVFVHMNQEYILLGSWLWKILNKNVYMWRNHHAGSFLTDIAAFFCKNVFCTSKYSYTAKYKKTIIMPVGVDLNKFKQDDLIDRKPNSILFLGRISPVKKPDLFIKAVSDISTLNPNIIGNIYGNSLEKDVPYFNSLKKMVDDLNLSNNIKFYSGIPNDETVGIYNSNNIFINLSSSGMYDKTIFEAIACGCLVVVSNENLRGEISDDCIFKEENLQELVLKIENLLSYSNEERELASKKLKIFAESHSLKKLSEKLFQIIK